MRTRQLPLGLLYPAMSVAIGSGVAVDPQIVHDAVARYGLQGRGQVDYRCPIITAEHRRSEREDALAHAITTIGWHCWASNVGSRAVAATVGFEQVREYGVWYCQLRGNAR